MEQKKLRAIYVVSHANASGPINQSLNIMIGMCDNPLIDDTFITLDFGDQNNVWLNRFIEAHIPCIAFNEKHKFRIRKYIHDLRKYIINNHIEVVHCSGFRANIICTKAAKGLAVVISTIRSEPAGLGEKVSKPFQSLFRKICLNVIKNTPVKVACSKSLQKTYARDFGIQMECVQNGVNTDFFKPLTEDEKNVLKEKMGFDSHDIIYLVLGHLLPRKNNSIIIDALNSVEDFEGKIVFVGAGTEEGLLKEKALNNERIVFTGATTEPLKYLQISDFLISSSLAEGLPNTVLEALSTGLIPILSNIEPHKELVENTPVEFLFSPNCSNELAGLLQQSQEWNKKKLSESAREIAVDNFGIASLANKYLTIYSKYRTSI